MAEDESGSPDGTRNIWIAVITALVATAGFKFLLHWGVIPALIGGFSIGVIWFSVNRAFAGQR